MILKRGYKSLVLFLSLWGFFSLMTWASVFEGAKQIDYIEFRDTDIREVLRSIADLSGVNIIAATGVKGNITLSLKKVSLKDALHAILAMDQLTFREKGNIIIVEKLGKKETRFLRLNYADANDIREIVEPLKSDGGSILVDARSNMLVVNDYEEKLIELERIIAELDLPTPQVTIEAKILDLEVSDAMKLGINVSTTHSEGDPQNTDEQNRWSNNYDLNEGELGRSFTNSANRGISQTYGMRLTEDTGSTGGFGEPTNQNTTFNFVSDKLVKATNENRDLSIDGLLTSVVSKSVADLINVQIDALIQEGKSLLLAAPTISTLNNETASIIIGEKVGIKEQTQTTTGTTETVRFQDVGTKLEVTPQINGDGFITMSIKPEISSVKTFLSDEIRFNTREARTKVRVKSHNTVIIGGLILNNENKGNRRVPFISKIPLVGYLFKGLSNNGSQRELVVFLTPYILDQSSPEEVVLTPQQAEEKRREEAKAKEEELLERFYTGLMEKKPNVALREDKANAKLLYKEALKLARKAKRIEKERGKKVAEMALTKFRRVVDLYPETDYAPKSLFQMALIKVDLNEESSEAMSLLEELMKDYPHHDIYRKAEKKLKKIRDY